MSEKQVIQKLVMFEFRSLPFYNIIMLIASPILSGVLFSLLLTSTPYFEPVVDISLRVIIDGLFIFMIAYTLASRWKPFNFQKLNEDLFASSFFILLRQLPFSEASLIKSRLIIAVIYLVPLTLIFTGCMYVLNADLRELVPIFTLPSLFITWSALAISFGMIFVAGEPGFTLKKWQLISYNVFIYGIGFSILILSQYVYEYGLVYLTIDLAVKYPLLTPIGAVIVTMIFARYWVYVMKKYMRKVNYHV